VIAIFVYDRNLTN